MDFITVRITRIIDETADTKTFYLEASDKQPIPYEAGQFVTLVIQHGSSEVRRSYSLGSAPSHDNQLFITVKRKVNGEISRLLLDYYKVGDTLEVLPPSGKFVMEKISDIHHYFFFTAGSGIVPVFGLLKEILHQSPHVKITLINQSRDEENIIYKNDIARLVRDFSQLEYVQFYSAPIQHQLPVIRLNNAIAEKMIQERVDTTANKNKYRFFICGPTTFMRSVQFTVKLLGYADEQIRTEKFVIQQNNRHLPAIGAQTPKTVMVIFPLKKEHFTVQYPDTILQAAKKAKINLPYSCEAGQCSTCAVICTQGSVVMSVNDILTQKDLQRGFILTCSGHPTSDIELNYLPDAKL